MTAATPILRFREARERLGLSESDVAREGGIPAACIWDIENIEGDLTAGYSPRQIQRLCSALRIRPVELFVDEIKEPPLTAEELVRRIHEECRCRGIALQQFEDAVGWKLSASMDAPERLLEDMTVDGLQWLCRELCLDWRRVLLSL